MMDSNEEDLVTSLKTVIKWEIQHLVQRLAEYGTDTIVLSVNGENGDIDELGSEKAQQFLASKDQSQIKAEFAWFCQGNQSPTSCKRIRKPTMKALQAKQDKITKGTKRKRAKTKVPSPETYNSETSDAEECENQEYTEADDSFNELQGQNDPQCENDTKGENYPQEENDPQGENYPQAQNHPQEQIEAQGQPSVPQQLLYIQDANNVQRLVLVKTEACTEMNVTTNEKKRQPKPKPVKLILKKKAVSKGGKKTVSKSATVTSDKVDGTNETNTIISPEGKMKIVKKNAEENTPETPETSEVRARRQYSFEQLMNAYRAVKEDGMSLRMAARTFSVPPTTLKDRLDGKVVLEPVRSGPKTLFTPYQEKLLADHVSTLAVYGYRLMRTEVLALATNYADHIGAKYKRNSIGHSWYSAFMTRWPQVKKTILENLKTPPAGFIVFPEIEEGFDNEAEQFVKYQQLIMLSKVSQGSIIDDRVDETVENVDEKVHIEKVDENIDEKAH